MLSVRVARLSCEQWCFFYFRLTIFSSHFSVWSQKEPASKSSLFGIFWLFLYFALLARCLSVACVLDRCLSPLPFPLIKRFLPLYLPLFLPAYYLLVILYINCRLLSQLCSLLRPLLARLGCRRIQPKPFSLIVRAHTRNVRVTFLARPLCPGELIERGIFLFFFWWRYTVFWAQSHSPPE